MKKFKIVLLTCAVATSALYSNNPTLQELCDKSRQKQEQLAQLDRKLIEQKRLIFFTTEEATALRQQYIDFVKTELIEQEATQEVIDMVINETVAFIDEKIKEARSNFFNEVVNKNLMRATLHTIEQELHGDYKAKWLALIKFDVIQHEMALSVLSNLMKDWQNCLTEILEIDKEIEQLESLAQC